MTKRVRARAGRRILVAITLPQATLEAGKLFQVPMRIAILNERLNCTLAEMLATAGPCSIDPQRSKLGA